MNIPEGKILFGWKPSYIAGGSITNTVLDAVDMGLSVVNLKVGSGVSKYPFNNYNLRPLVDALHANGIKVYGWHYVHGANNPLYEARIAEQQIHDLGLDGYEIDAEAHYKGYKWTQASELMQRMNAITNNEDIPLGLTTYRYPVYHQDFPWRGFLKYCNYWVPQVYWQPPPSSPVHELNRSVTQWKEEAAKWEYEIKPFVPAGRVYIGDGYPLPGPTVAEINEFMTACKQDHPACTFWSFDNLYTHAGGTTRKETIEAFEWETEPETPPIEPPTDPDLEKRVTGLEVRVDALEEETHSHESASEIITLVVTDDKANATAQVGSNAAGYPVIERNVFQETKDGALHWEWGEKLDVFPTAIRADGGKYFYEIANIPLHGYPALYVDKSKVK